MNDFTRLVRSHAEEIIRQGMETFDFSTMYTSFDQRTILENVMEAFGEAQQEVASMCPTGSDVPSITEKGWVFGEGWSADEVRDMLWVTLSTAYTVNGGKVRRQVRGMPMGIPHAPQMANLACYVVERDYMLVHKPKGLVCRFIDDFFTSGMQPPPQDLYGMSYQKTSKDSRDVVYLGIRCRIDRDRLRTSVFDREEDYPFHITRYPDWGTTAPRAQLGGVLMGRFICCLEACAHMQDFKESVANVMRHALWRNYPEKVMSSVWSRFLQRRWQSTDIRGRELQCWFRQTLQQLHAKGLSKPPDSRTPQPHVRHLLSSVQSTDSRPQRRTHRPEPLAVAPSQADSALDDLLALQKSESPHLWAQFPGPEVATSSTTRLYGGLVSPRPAQPTTPVGRAAQDDPMEICSSDSDQGSTSGALPSPSRGGGSVLEGANGALTSPLSQGAVPEGAPAALTSPPRGAGSVLGGALQLVPSPSHLQIIERPVPVMVPAPIPVHVPVPIHVPIAVHVPMPIHVPVPAQVQGPTLLPGFGLPPGHGHDWSLLLQWLQMLVQQSPTQQQAATGLEATPLLALPAPPEPEPQPEPEPEAERREPAGPFLLEWRRTTARRRDQGSSTKRPAEEAPEGNAFSQPLTPRSSQSPPKKGKRIVKDLWPQEWLDQFQDFISDTRDTAKRRRLYLSWPRDFQEQAWYWVSSSVRQQFDEWDALSSPAPSQQQQQQLSQQPEARCHNWQEGARIGEAQNPGPQGQGHPTRRRAPGRRQTQHQTTGMQHGACAWSNPPAGELAKGAYPGPTPCGDHVCGLHGGNAAGNQNSSRQEMPFRPSRAGSAQRSQLQPEDTKAIIEDMLTQIRGLGEQIQRLEQCHFREPFRAPNPEAPPEPPPRRKRKRGRGKKQKEPPPLVRGGHKQAPLICRSSQIIAAKGVYLLLLVRAGISDPTDLAGCGWACKPCGAPLQTRPVLFPFALLQPGYI